NKISLCFVTNLQYHRNFKRQFHLFHFVLILIGKPPEKALSGGLSFVTGFSGAFCPEQQHLRHAQPVSLRPAAAANKTLRSQVPCFFVEKGFCFWRISAMIGVDNI
ncbi:MAG: hypothetical protein LUD54_07855, partial [Oscillospiraceae bacterium]|nr:hypothetical protein [Oscillospiraceae bacterium]